MANLTRARDAAILIALSELNAAFVGAALMARPSTYDQAIADEICLRIVEGSNIAQLCREDREGRFPDRSTLFRWMARNPSFRQNYTIAMELHADHLADTAMAIANNATEDTRDGKSNMAAVNRDRLIVDTIKWRCAKLFPRKYSERYQVSGHDEQPIAQSVAHLPMNSDEVKAHFKSVLDRAEQDMGVAPPADATDEQRLSALMTSGENLSPELYELKFSAAKPKGKLNGHGS